MTAPTLDHLVVAVRDLPLAAERYQRLLGRAPSWRGRHPSYGTANVLFRLDNGYLELLAPDSDGADDSPWRQALCERLDTDGEGLYAIALGVEDIDATVARVRDRGLNVLDPADGDGEDLSTGARRQWRNARIPPSATRGVPTFFIQHRSPADALPVATATAEERAVVAGFDHTVIASSHLAACLRLWHELIGLDLRRTLDRPNGRRLHFLRLGDSILELAGEAGTGTERGGGKALPPDPQPSTPREGGGEASTLDPRPSTPGEAGQGRDLLWGVAYRVGDVARTVARLRAEGIEVSDPREGNAPGTIVADLKPGFSHEVRTLFIQYERCR